MYYALLVQRDCGDFKNALHFAKVAAPIFAATRKRRELTPRERYLVGQLHFLAGSCLALAADDHDGAVQWYDAGAHLLTEPLLPHVVEDVALLGDQLVSMGVSYWRAGKQERAIEVTRHGVRRLQQAAGERQAPPESLAAAYGNLAAMLRAAKRPEEAAQWTAMQNELGQGTERAVR
jgi:hypothetical protein